MRNKREYIRHAVVLILNYRSKIIANCLWPSFSAVFILAFVTSVLAQTPTLRANGKIAFTSDRNGNLEIYVMNPDGSNQVRITSNNVVDACPTWSPDGRKIAFVSNRDGNQEIYVMNADGSNPVNLTTHSAQEFNPAWSPDGSKIAFETNRDGNVEIYVMNADGTNLVRVTNHPATDAFPAWKP